VTQFSSSWVDNLPPDSPALRKLLAGRMVDVRELGADVPPDFRLYLELGRFRNAIVAAEERKTGNINLTRFIDTYGLGGYRVGND
jgi:hypothetical protein